MSELSRLRWRSRRGTKELDLMFERYLEAHAELLDAEHVAQLDRLLDQEDDCLQRWLLYGESVERAELIEIAARVRRNFIPDSEGVNDLSHPR